MFSVSAELAICRQKQTCGITANKNTPSSPVVLYLFRVSSRAQLNFGAQSGADNCWSRLLTMVTMSSNRDISNWFLVGSSFRWIVQIIFQLIRQSSSFHCIFPVLSFRRCSSTFGTGCCLFWFLIHIFLTRVTPAQTNQRPVITVVVCDQSVRMKWRKCGEQMKSVGCSSL